VHERVRSQLKKVEARKYLDWIEQGFLVQCLRLTDNTEALTKAEKECARLEKAYNDYLNWKEGQTNAR
jgi:hypothetical protein